MLNAGIGKVSMNNTQVTFTKSLWVLKTQRAKSSRSSPDIFLTGKVQSLNLHHLWDALCIKISARMENKLPHIILQKKLSQEKKEHRKMTAVKGLFKLATEYFI